MGALLGLLAGTGLLMVLTGRRSARQPARGVRGGRIEAIIARADQPALTPVRLVGACAGSGVAVFVVAAGLSRAPVVALFFAGFAAYLPIAIVRRRAAARTTERVAVWPDAVDNLASAVRAGLALPEAVAQLGERGPEVLRPAFAAFAADYRATGRFGECLDRLKEALADPVADRVVESLRIAREVGGSELGRLLRTLSRFLREDARTRAELQTRQGWTVGAARLALAAPWLVLAMLAVRPGTVAAYNGVTGATVLLVGAAVSLAAYRAMVRIARLPDNPRVFQ